MRRSPIASASSSSFREKGRSTASFTTCRSGETVSREYPNRQVMDAETHEVAELAKVGENEREEAVDEQAERDLLGSVACGSDSSHNH